MIETIQDILGGQDVRQNLSSLRQELKEEGARGLETLAAAMKENREKWLALLKDEDAKIRKNAALLIGDSGLPEFLDALYEAYERETQLFVKSSYLKALGNLDYSKYLESLKERVKKLAEKEFTPENNKHAAEELKALSELIIHAEGISRHRFTGLKDRTEVILTANRLHREVTAGLLEQKAGLSGNKVKLLPAGVRFETDSIDPIMSVRTFQELLFRVPGMKTCPADADAAAVSVSESGLLDFLEKCHDGGAPFYFRIEVRSKLPLDKKSRFAKKLSAGIERLTGRKLINSPSAYEAELRFIANKEGNFNVAVKLHTIQDDRFSYRGSIIAAGMKPVNAALLVELARPFMKKDAKVLDPFCGSGTLLIERQKAVPGNTAYGIDVLADAIEAARRNTEAAGQIIHYINRDFFDFTHDYLFDEIITDMPFALGQMTQEGVRSIHERFLDRARDFLTQDGALIVYTHNPEALNWMARRKGYTVIKQFLISEKDGTGLIILKP